MLEGDEKDFDSEELTASSASPVGSGPATTEACLSESMYEKFMKKQNQSTMKMHAICKSRSESSDDELSSSSDCLTANLRHSHVSLDRNQDIDIEMGTMKSHNKPNVIFQQLNPIEMDIYQRRVNFMKTHGEFAGCTCLMIHL